MDIVEYLKTHLNGGKTIADLQLSEVYISCFVPYTLNKHRIIEPLKCVIKFKDSVMENEEQFKSLLEDAENVSQITTLVDFIKCKPNGLISCSESAKIPYYGKKYVQVKTVVDYKDNHIQIDDSMEDSVNTFNLYVYKTKGILDAYAENQIRAIKESLTDTKLNLYKFLK